MISGATAAKIVRDVSLGVPPEKSKLKYTPEMLAFRAQAVKEWEDHLENNPDAELHVPEDLPDADIPVDE
jgi:hypothetical protein